MILSFLSAMVLMPSTWAWKHAPDTHWVDIWTAMPQLTEPANLPPAPFVQNASDSVFNNTTLRQTIRLPLGSDTIRLRLSNAFGSTDLPITNVTVALTANGELGNPVINSETVKPVFFSGASDILIPNGALAVSDPIKFPLKAQRTVTVDIYLQSGQQGNAITSHPGSRTTSWMAFGNWVGESTISDPSLASVDHWYFLSAVEALLPKTAHSCVLIGDSITDGRGSNTNQNNRWPDLLQLRLSNTTKTSKHQIALLNQAAGGNRLLTDGLGTNALSRLDRDALSHSGVTHAIIFIGVNDIGVADPSASTQKRIGDGLITAYKQIVTRLHAAGITVYGATITPFGTPVGDEYVQPYSNAERERTRQRVNGFIRRGGVFDAFLDFDAVLRDEQNQQILKKEFDSGDHLHPNVEGYRALAGAVPLGYFF